MWLLIFFQVSHISLQNLKLYQLWTNCYLFVASHIQLVLDAQYNTVCIGQVLWSPIELCLVLGLSVIISSLLLPEM